MDSEKVIKKAERIICSTVDRDMIDSFCEDVIALLKEQQEQIDRLIEENASNAEMAEGLKELLKEQEAVEPKKAKGYNPPMYTLYEYECKECKSPMMNKQPFCMGCGRQVKWE